MRTGKCTNSSIPKAILPIRHDDEVIPESIINQVLAFTGIYMTLFVVATLCMLAMGLDMVSAASSVAATLGNVGPGLGSVGPLANYAHLPCAGKLLLTFMMLVGRLEIFSVLVILTPAFGRSRTDLGHFRSQFMIPSWLTVARGTIAPVFVLSSSSASAHSLGFPSASKCFLRALSVGIIDSTSTAH